MKNYKVRKHAILSILGLVSMMVGLVVVKLFPEIQPMIRILPFLCIGIGAGIFGENLGIAVNNYVFLKYPSESKKAKIEENDERNAIIKNKAKGKSYDLMFMVFGALILAFALQGVELYILITLVVAYLFIPLSNSFYLLKFQKEM